MNANNSPGESHKNTIAGLLLILIVIIIGVIPFFIEK